MSFRPSFVSETYGRYYIIVFYPRPDSKTVHAQTNFGSRILSWIFERLDPLPIKEHHGFESMAIYVNNTEYYKSDKSNVLRKLQLPQNVLVWNLKLYSRIYSQ
jgi:hypothetical protein